jgi:N-hydroxyarylamine O-acetyltransferase
MRPLAATTISAPLPSPLRDRVLARLALDPPPRPDVDGLRAVYGAWCARVPFDNVRKMIGLRAGDGAPLPGGDAAEFLARWLADGCGGTCWPGSVALHALLRSLGFDARLVAGAMRDLGVVNHGSVKVAIDGRDWLVDSSMLGNEPLPLGDAPWAGRDPVHAVEVEPDGGTHVVWFEVPPHDEGGLPCRLLLDPVDRAFCVDAYERSREGSPFNQRLYARRNVPGGLVVLRGPTRYHKTARGVEQRELGRDEVVAALRDEIGLSAALVERWVASGALDATLAPPSGGAPPPLARRAPSRRGGGR